MRIVILDLMPLLWVMCAAAALLLLRAGEWGAPTRTLPAVTAAMILYFVGLPPRVQVLGFLGIYLTAALCRGILLRIAAMRRRRTQAHKEAPQ